MEPFDDKTIADEDPIVRRVNPTEHVVLDENLGKRRLSSKLWSPSTNPKGGMSCDLPKAIEADGLDPYAFVTTPKYIASVAFAARDARQANLRIGCSPVPEGPSAPGNPYHAEVWGAEEKAYKFTGAQKRALMRSSNWFVPLEGVEIPRD